MENCSQNRSRRDHASQRGAAYKNQKPVGTLTRMIVGPGRLVSFLSQRTNPTNSPPGDGPSMRRGQEPRQPANPWCQLTVPSGYCEYCAPYPGTVPGTAATCRHPRTAGRPRRSPALLCKLVQTKTVLQPQVRASSSLGVIQSPSISHDPRVHVATFEFQTSRGCPGL